MTKIFKVGDRVYYLDAEDITGTIIGLPEYLDDEGNGEYEVAWDSWLGHASREDLEWNYYLNALSDKSPAQHRVGLCSFSRNGRAGQ